MGPMFHRVAVIGSLLIAGLASITSAQINPGQVTYQSAADVDQASPHGMVNSATLAGNLRTMDNRPVSNARVELHDWNGSIVASTYTRPNGQFEFSHINTGRYEIIATSGLNETRDRVSIDRGDNAVILRLSEGDGNADVGSSSSVSVAEMRVPEKARKALNKARDLQNKQKFDEARKELNNAIAAYPYYADAYRQRGILNLQQNKFDDARADLEAAIKNDPSSGFSYIALAAIYNNDSKFDDALRVLDRGVALAPNMWQAYFELSRAYVGKGDFESALRNSEKATHFMPNDYPPLHLVRAHALLGLKNYSEAVNELEVFIASNPSGPDSAAVRETITKVKAFTARAAK